MSQAKQNLVEQLKETLVGAFHFLWTFIRNPIPYMKNVPEIPSSELITAYAALSTLTGLAMGIISQSLFTMLWAVFIYPFVVLITSAVLSLIVFYSASYFSKTKISFQAVYTAVFLASVPALILRVAFPVLKSVDIVGFAISSILLKMSLEYYFGLDKKNAKLISFGLYSLLLLQFLGAFLI
ncbi:MAG: hypothetical protein AB8E15_13020 [Bdellovibrionales bacterium]